MKLSLEPEMRIYIRCEVCSHSTAKHDPNCPEGALRKLLDNHFLLCFKCPQCHAQGHTVDVNTGDFYECKECHAVFSTGMATPMVAAEDCREAYLLSDDAAIKVLVLPQKGDGQFKIDRTIKLLQAEKVSWLRDRQREIGKALKKLNADVCRVCHVRHKGGAQCDGNP